MRMKITIHQPEHIGWLGLIDKISQVDVFVILDNVQYEKKYFQNRNKIRTKDGWKWLTVPVKKFHQDTLIKDIEISYERDWTKKYLNDIKQNYGKAPHFSEVYPEFERIILKKHKYLSELNVEILKYVLKCFGIETKIMIASEMELGKIKGGNEVNLAICKQLNAQTYLSGINGQNYMDLDDFAEEDITVEFQHFNHIEYKQQFKPFISGMCSLDFLFNEGSKCI